MFIKAIVLAAVVSLIGPSGAQKAQLSLRDAIVMAGHCLQWDAKVIDTLPVQFGIQKEAQGTVTVVKGVMVTPTLGKSGISCGVPRLIPKMVFQVNVTPLALIDFVDKTGVETFHMFIDLGPDQNGVHSFLASTVRKAPASEMAA